MMAYTPGPWVTADKRFANGIRTEVEAESGIICSCIRTVNSRMVRTWDEVDANAKLIAAAPELLAALKGMVALIRTGYGCFDAVPEWQAATDAINKAEGRG